jgi:signal transduction histidine kinase/CheY-like chemotaxis protein
VALALALTGYGVGAQMYAVLAVGAALAGALDYSPRLEPRPAGDLFAATIGVAITLVGAGLLLGPPTDPAAEVTPVLIRVLGAALAVTGPPLVAVQLVAVSRWAVWAAHLAAGLAMVALAVTRAVPTRAWTGIAIYGGFGLIVALLPTLRRRLAGFDPASLRSRLALSLACATGVALIVTVALVAHQEERLAERELTTMQQAQARSIARTIADYIDLNATRTVALGLLAGKLPMTQEDQRAFLESSRLSYREISVLATVDSSGAVIARTPGPRLDPALLAEVAARIREHGGRETELRLTRPVGRTVLLLAAPVVGPQGEVLGVMVTVHDSKSLAGRIKNERAWARISDHSGRLIAAGGLPPAGSNALGSPVATSAEVPGLGWVVSVERERSMALAGVRRGREYAFLLLLAVAGLAIVLGIVAARRIAGPLSRLARAAEQLAAGNPQVPLPRTKITEVDQLSASFREMRDSLAQRTRESERLAAELRARAEALAEADRRKDEFLAMLAHELRNPLGAISNASYLIEQLEPAEQKVGHSAAIIRRQTRHLTRLVDDLLDVSRITRGKVELRRERLDLGAVAASVAETLRPVVEGRQLELRPSLPAEPVPVSADATRLEQVIGNLIRNAVKFTEPGGTIGLEVRRVGDSAMVAVTDTGVGIDPALLPRVFELFAQGQQPLDRSGAGLGIGLTLVRSLVEMHGGSVSADSAGTGRGSRFEVRLPCAPAADGWQRADGGDGEAPADHRALDVLVVEDNRDAAAMLALLLERYGHRVRVAHDGATALAEVRERLPAAVLLDIGLPGMDGYQLAAALRDLPGGEGLLLVALTGYGREDDRRRSREVGFDHHLTKPVEPRVLQELLDAAATATPRPSQPAGVAGGPGRAS